MATTAVVLFAPIAGAITTSGVLVAVLGIAMRNIPEAVRRREPGARP